jgi:hypothetical protein
VVVVVVVVVVYLSICLSASLKTNVCMHAWMDVRMYVWHIINPSLKCCQQQPQMARLSVPGVPGVPRVTVAVSVAGQLAFQFQLPSLLRPGNHTGNHVDQVDPEISEAV